MENYIINNDTIFNNENLKYTIDYFNKISNQKDTIKDIKKENRINEIFNSFQENRLEFTSKYIFSYKIDSKGKRKKSEEKVSYELIGNKVIINKKDIEKFNYEIEYNENQDILVINQTDKNLKASNTYIRTKK